MAKSKRIGLIGTKLGMTQIFNSKGESIPVTLIHIKENYIVDSKTKERDGYSSVMIGYSEAKSHRVSKPMKGIYAKANVPTLTHLKEFKVLDSTILDIGKRIDISHFVKGQLIDVSGTSIGKGFAGVMKRHNFKGLEASHGVSASHRSHGSTGQRQDPGKVFKGKKMAGHMGSTKITIQSLEIVDIDQKLNIISIRGAIPGSKNGIVYLTDAIKKARAVSAPFPTNYVNE